MDQTRRKIRDLSSQRAALLSFLTFATVSSALRAEEPRLVSEPYLLQEPAEVTQVVDSFDDGDPFDLNLSVGYQYATQSADILRETSGSGSTMNVARYTETTHRLNTRADIGLYHDIALVLRMPIILANDRSLDQGSGDSAGTAGTSYDGTTGLFRAPFHAPTRSGIEYLAVGLDFGILNQYRDRSKPTWVFGFEGRFDVSSPMHACNKDAPTGQVQCADPGDVNRNGQYDHDTPTSMDSTGTINLESPPGSARKAGVSRGTTGLEVHTYVSKRIKYIEPYGGLKMLAEFPTGKSDYGALDFESSLVNKPPLEGTVLFGLAIIPWEVRSEHQRTTIDLRFSSTYRSEGRDYSELYDALGSSPAGSLRVPAWSGYMQGTPVTTTDPVTGATTTTTPSVIDPNSKRAYFNGLTDVQQHVKNRLSAEFTWQAARFVKFSVGAGYTMIQSHYITYDQACNANFTDNPDKSGPCRKENAAGSSTPFNVTGVPNPNYRQSINIVGRRYLVSDSNLLDGWINATVMF